MKLLTKELEKKIPPLYSQENNPDPMVVAKFFNPCGAATWWIIEGQYEEESQWDEENNKMIPDYVMFGLAMLFGPNEAELGYISLNELASVKLPFGLGIERDMYWSPRPLSEVKKEQGIR